MSKNYTINSIALTTYVRFILESNLRDYFMKLQIIRILFKTKYLPNCYICLLANVCMLPKTIKGLSVSTIESLFLIVH